MSNEKTIDSEVIRQELILKQNDVPEELIPAVKRLQGIDFVKGINFGPSKPTNEPHRIDINEFNPQTSSYEVSLIKSGYENQMSIKIDFGDANPECKPQHVEKIMRTFYNRYN